MRTVTLSEDDLMTLLVALWMMAVTLEETRQLLVMADNHLPGELRYDAREVRSKIAFIGGLGVSEN